MKSLFAFGLTFAVAAFAVLPAAAQHGGRSNALGGSAGARSMTRPLGGFSSGPNRFSSGPNRGFRGAGRLPLYGGYPYGYSFYWPDYFDSLDDFDQPYGPYISSYGAPPPVAPAYYAPVPGAPGPQQPVIINQYFGAPGPEPVNAQAANNSNAQAAGDPIGAPQNYYLIAYKNHAVYAALAYWVEDKTLHYVTTQNTHNQASLDLIDLTLTKSLNQGRDIPFTIPGQ